MIDLIAYIKSIGAAPADAGPAATRPRVRPRPAPHQPRSAAI